MTQPRGTHSIHLEKRFLIITDYHREVVNNLIDLLTNITTGHRVVDKLTKRSFNTNPNPSTTHSQEQIPLPEGNTNFVIKYLF